MCAFPVGEAVPPPPLPARSGRRLVRPAAAALLFTLAVGVALLRIGTFSRVGEVRLSAADWVMVDFRAAVHYPTKAFWEGNNPYDAGTYLARYPAAGAPFPVYAPATFLMYLPFGLVSVAAASATYFALTIVLTVILSVVALRMSGWKASTAPALAVAGVILLSRPGQWNLLLGQVTLTAVLGTYMAIAWAHRGSWAAGAGLALSLMKPTFGVPLALILAAQGAWRTVLKGIGIAALINLPVLAILISRSGGVKPFVLALVKSQEKFAQEGHNDLVLSITRIDAPALLSRLQGTPLATVAEGLVAAVVIGVAALGLRRLGPSVDERSARVAITITCCALLLSVYHHVYDLLLLTLPVVAVVRAWKLGSCDRSVFLLEAGLFIILAGNYFATESALNAMHPGPAGRLALLSANAVVLLAIFGLYLYQALNGPVYYRKTFGQSRNAGSSAHFWTPTP
jgi:hypothetical protein